MNNKSYRQWLQAKTGLDSQEIAYILKHVTGKSLAAILASPEEQLSTAEQNKIASILAQRLTGVPLAYLTGKQQFWDMEFIVNPDCLIPRADTECLIEFILARYSEDGTSLRVLDLGTGTGCIGLVLKKHRPNWQVTLSDLSQKALLTAAANAAYHHLEVSICNSDWFDSLQGDFDIIVSNPPYVANSDRLEPGCYHEPASSLFAGKTGLDAIHQIITNSTRFARGLVVIEHAATQGEAVTAKLRRHGYTKITSIRDLGGHHRATAGMAPVKQVKKS